MAVRQYIGARYTTKVYKNSQDPNSCEWENVEFEPLTIVSFQNSSYLSRTNVPANVGNPTVATQYWAQTGFYNGQIAHLQDEIDGLDTRLTLLDTKKFITIGDSYNTTDTTSAGDHVYPWSTKFSSFLGLTANTNWWNSGYSGAGFVNGTTFLSQLQTIAAGLTTAQKNSITDIIVAGGTNDGAYISDLYDAIEDFASYVKTNFPNALIRLYYISWGVPKTWSVHWDEIRSVYASRHISNMAMYPDAFQTMLLKTNFCNDWGHPNERGANAIATYMMESILGGTGSVCWSVSSTYTVTVGDSNLTGQIKELQDGTAVSVVTNVTNIVNGDIEITAGTAYGLNIQQLYICNPPTGTIIAEGDGYAIDMNDKIYGMHWKIYKDTNGFSFRVEIVTAGNTYFSGHLKTVIFTTGPSGNQYSIKTFMASQV